MPPLSDSQEKVLALLPIIPSLLSLAGSSTIIYVVYQHFKSKKKTTVYHRLLVGMSLCDIVFSFWFPWIAFLVPSSSNQPPPIYPRVWAIGTTGTCTFVGFIFNIAFTGLLYNAVLSYYFLLTARFGWRDDDIARRAEVWMHLGAVVYPITTALVFVGIGAYAEQSIGAGCWLGPYPENCGSGPGQTPCLTPLLGWISAGVPVLVGFFSILVNNLVIWWHVRKTVRKGKRYSTMQYQTQQSQADSTRSVEGGSGFLAASSRLFAKRAAVDSQTRRSQAVAVQAAFYVLVFFLNYIWTMVLRNIGAQEAYWTDEHESDLFGLLVMQAIFLPAQGFFNLCVFSRPKYLRTRKCFPLQSRFWCFRRAMFGEAIKQPRPKQKKNRRHNFYASPPKKPPPSKPAPFTTTTTTTSTTASTMVTTTTSEEPTSSTTASFCQANPNYDKPLSLINEDESEQGMLKEPAATNGTSVAMTGTPMPEGQYNNHHNHNSRRASLRSSAATDVTSFRRAEMEESLRQQEEEAEFEAAALRELEQRGAVEPQAFRGSSADLSLAPEDLRGSAASAGSYSPSSASYSPFRGSTASSMRGSSASPFRGSSAALSTASVPLRGSNGSRGSNPFRHSDNTHVRRSDNSNVSTSRHGNNYVPGSSLDFSPRSILDGSNLNDDSNMMEYSSKRMGGSRDRYGMGRSTTLGSRSALMMGGSSMGRSGMGGSSMLSGGASSRRHGTSRAPSRLRQLTKKISSLALFDLKRDTSWKSQRSNHSANGNGTMSNGRIAEEDEFYEMGNRTMRAEDMDDMDSFLFGYEEYSEESDEEEDEEEVQPFDNDVAQQDDGEAGQVELQQQPAQAFAYAQSPQQVQEDEEIQSTASSTDEKKIPPAMMQDDDEGSDHYA